MAGPQYCALLNKSGISLDFQLNGTLLGPLIDDLEKSFERIRSEVELMLSGEKWVCADVTLRELRGQSSTKLSHVDGPMAKPRHDNSNIFITVSCSAWYSKVVSLFAMLSSTLGEGFAAELGGAFESQVGPAITQLN